MEDDGRPLQKFKRFWGMNRQDEEDVTEEGIMSMVNEGHEKGVVQESEAEMIENIFAMDDKEAHDIMTHRKNMVLADASLTLRMMLNQIVDAGFSRYPVYKDTVDNIVGIIYIKDILRYVLDDSYMDTPLEDLDGLIQPVSFIPETRNIDILFKRMQSLKTHLVVVVDEYGQTAGIVTMEDILEEIVGNIFDEHEKVEHPIIENEDGSFFMEGMTELEEVCDLLEIEDEDLENFDTLNGFLISCIDKIPEDGETFTVQSHGYEFQILQVKRKMIQKVRVRKLAGPTAKPAGL